MELGFQHRYVMYENKTRNIGKRTKLKYHTIDYGLEEEFQVLLQNERRSRHCQNLSFVHQNLINGSCSSVYKR